MKQPFGSCYSVCVFWFRASTAAVYMLSPNGAAREPNSWANAWRLSSNVRLGLVFRGQLIWRKKRARAKFKCHRGLWSPWKRKSPRKGHRLERSICPSCHTSTTYDIKICSQLSIDNRQTLVFSIRSSVEFSDFGFRRVYVLTELKRRDIYSLNSYQSLLALSKLQTINYKPG